MPFFDSLDFFASFLHQGKNEGPSGEDKRIKNVNPNAQKLQKNILSTPSEHISSHLPAFYHGRFPRVAPNPRVPLHSTRGY
jgi:hypothetical protein